MEYRSTLSKKLGGSSFTGTSIYDGVFSGSAPFRPSSFSSSASPASRPEDYAEIFGGPRDSRRSSIPVLDVPALHDRKVSVDVRTSKLEYSNIFGGGSEAGGISYEDVVVEPRKMRNLSRQEQNRAHTQSSSEVSFGGSEDNQGSQKASHPSPDKVKKQFNVSYNKSVGAGKDGLNGMTHVAQLSNVPGYACLVDEKNPSKQLKADKPVTNGAHSEYGAGDRAVKATDMKKSESMSSPDKQYSKDVRQSGSRSNSSLYEGYEFGLRTEPFEVQASSGFSPNFSCSKGNFASKASLGEVSEGGVCIGSPSYFDEEVDANSMAAASADAVRKAIEQAQARIKIAKEMMERRKEAFQGDGDSKSLREPRRERRKASKVKETELPEQRIKEYEKVDSMKTGLESTDINDHGTHCNNVSRHKDERLSIDAEEYSLQEETAERDARKLSINAESDETETKPLENKQGASVKKIVPLTDDCEMPMTRATTESAAEVSRLLTAVEAAPLSEVHHKNECRPSTAEGAQEPDKHSDKAESSGQLQYVEADGRELEVKGEKRESPAELTTYHDDKKYHADLEGYHESSSEMNLDAHRLEEKTVRAEDSARDENEEKESAGHEVGSIRSNILHSEEKTGYTASMNCDGKEENQREGERYARECDQEQNEKQSENCEAEGNVGSRNISDGEVESTSRETIEGKEKSGDAPSESCETKGEEESEDLEAADNLQESKKEYSGFNLGADARQWLDHMKEILHVRINSFLDAKENNRPQEGGEDEGNCQLEAEVREEKIVEETCEVEAMEEVRGAQESMIDEKTTIELNMGREDEGQDAADEGKEDLHEEFTRTMGVANEENKESVDVNRDNYEDEEDEVMAHVTNLSVEEKESQDVDSINSNEPANLYVGEEDNSRTNLEEEEVCGSETSDLTRGSLEADGEKQVQDAMEGLRFSESDVKLGFTCVKFGFWQSNQYAERPEEVCEMGKHVEESDPQVDECCGDEKADEISSNKEEEVQEMAIETEIKTQLFDDDRWSDNEKAADVSSNEEEEAEEMTNVMEVKSKVSDDERWADNEATLEENQLHFVLQREERTLDDNQEMTASQAPEKEENQPTTQVTKEKETEDCSQGGTETERHMSKKRDDRKKWERENEREREKERLAVERAIREARERAFAEARERAERAAVEKAAAEARQRVMAQAREKLGKASSETSNKPAEKTSVEARLRAERAAVERATAEARERALERAMSEKLSGAGKDNKVRPKPSYDSQHKSSVPSSNHRNSSSSNKGVPRSTERSNGANAESAQWSKARLERHQRTAERAAKALAEKNMRDLLAQREQAERNRLAEALDADVKRWSNGKQGNLRALLSTLQYILGPDSGWQPVTLTEVVTAAAVKKAYRKATLCVHPDKLQQRGASLQQKYICEKVFDLLKEAWNRFSAEEK